MQAALPPRATALEISLTWLRKTADSNFAQAAILSSLVIAAIVAAWWALSPVSEVTTSAEVKHPPSTTLTLTPAQWGTLKIESVRKKVFDSLLTADGTIVANENASVAVYSQFSGRVVNVYAQAGQAVRKGTPLAAILAVEAAQTKSDTAAATAAEATLLKQLELAKVTERRQHELFTAEAGTEKDWLQSKADLAAAENAHRAAVAALAATREKAAVLGEAVQGRSGTAGQTMITAPIDGVIVQRQVAAGQFVNSLASGGSAPLFTVTDGRTVWVVANVSETQAAQLTLGQPAEIIPLALPGRSVKAAVSWIAASVDPSSRRVAVRAEVANPDGALKPQMSVTVRLLQRQPVEALSVPRSAIIFDGSKAHCFVVTSERTLAPRALQLGRVDSEVAEVKAGLQAGDQVVTRGTLFIDRASEDSAS